PVRHGAEPVGVRVLERGRERDRRALERYRERSEVARVGLQRRDGTVAPWDARGARELADVQEAPAVERPLDPVVGGDEPVEGRGRALHEAEVDERPGGHAPHARRWGGGRGGRPPKNVRRDLTF